tara:strand:+ start:43872 stop:44102 length:231 start_codon:yes stop_codon:yes gene_type:complete
MFIVVSFYTLRSFLSISKEMLPFILSYPIINFYPEIWSALLLIELKFPLIRRKILNDRLDTRCIIFEVNDIDSDAT